VKTLNDWEEDNICSSLASFATREILPHGHYVVWLHDYKGFFTINGFCNAHFGALNGLDFPAMSISKSKAPI